MNTENLIIDLRQHLPWHRRYMSNTSTAILWAVWLLLWRPFVLFWLLLELKKGAHLVRLIDVMSQSLEQGLIALLACAAVLWLWSRFMPEKLASKNVEPLLNSDYARYFQLPLQDLQAARQHKICVVQHDSQGQLIALQATQSQAMPLCLDQPTAIQTATPTTKTSLEMANVSTLNTLQNDTVLNRNIIDYCA